MSALEDRDFRNVPSIPEFFRWKTIFITGGSGFMGKVLIEKLLFSCSALDRIYVLVRSKKGSNADERLAQIYSSGCFDRLRKEKPNIFESKVFTINGDVSHPGLGLSEEDRTLLVNRVNIVFHAAASVRFDDTLSYAARLNLRSTVEIMDLVKDMRNLCAMIHVSTSFCNATRAQIDEVLYPPVADWRETLQICENLDDHTLRVLTPKYVGKVPNTYTFTKQLAEHVVYEAKGQVPVAIVRPSIVIPSLEEPVRGWVENYNGPVGITVSVSKGVLRCLYIRPDANFDYIPVDTSIRSIITAAWMRGTKPLDPNDDIPIYNSCMDATGRFTIDNTINLGMRSLLEVPINNAIWNPKLTTTNSRILYHIQVLLCHIFPAIFIDTVLRVLGKQPMLLKIQRRIYTSNEALIYFMNKHWTFTNEKLKRMRSCIKDEDLEQFYFTLQFRDKLSYYTACNKVVKVSMLKEKLEDIPKARAHNMRLWFLDIIVKVIFYGYLLKLLYTKVFVHAMTCACDILFN